MSCPVSVIAKPLADEKLTKKALSVVSKAMETKSVRRGVREVQKAIRRNQKGLVILSGDVTPIDFITHLPVHCENNSIPYFFVPSRTALGAAAKTRGATSVVMVVDPEEAVCAQLTAADSKAVKKLPDDVRRFAWVRDARRMQKTARRRVLDVMKGAAPAAPQ